MEMISHLGSRLPLWSALPFCGILLSIAMLPLLAPTFWRRRYPVVTAAWGTLLAAPLVAALGWPGAREILRTALVDYLPFILLLATLYVIGGGVVIRGALHGAPWTNAAIMVAGAGLASWIGTTGASLLLIRPLLRANRSRRYRAHTVIFFIFLVANVGGALTPLGDPPLFLGFLRGVPFFWTLALWREMFAVAAFVLVGYFLVEAFLWRRESHAVRTRTDQPRTGLRLIGWPNLGLLAGVLAAVVASGVWRPGSLDVGGIAMPISGLARDAALVALLLVSWRTTPHAIRLENEFSWGPIREVAVLFAGIFVTIIPLLKMLQAGEAGALATIVRGVRTPAQFFWATGTLSSVLDNAPTYLAFVSAALGRLHPGVPEGAAIGSLLAAHPDYLRAVATGAVFMGANTYIGNAPNLMVKTIAEHAGVRMPTFFAYVVFYALPVLVPAYVFVTWAFF